MMRPQRLLTATAATFAVTFAAMGQTPAPAPEPTKPASGADADTPAAVAAEHQPVKRRSIVHHYPYPYPEYYHGDQTAGFRNPGGRRPVPGVLPAREPVPGAAATRSSVATFDQGGGAPDRAEQTRRPSRSASSGRTRS